MIKMENIFLVSSPFCEKYKAGEENQWHQGIFKILFYIISTSHIYNILEANQTRVVSHPSICTPDQVNEVANT